VTLAVSYSVQGNFTTSYVEAVTKAAVSMRHIANTGRLVSMEISDFLPLVRAIHAPVLVVEKMIGIASDGQIVSTSLAGADDIQHSRHHG